MCEPRELSCFPFQQPFLADKTVGTHQRDQPAPSPTAPRPRLPQVRIDEHSTVLLQGDAQGQEEAQKV